MKRIERQRTGRLSLSASEWIAKLKEPRKVSELTALEQHFVFSLRLIAVYRRAGRDPLAELTTRLGSVTVAVKALQLVENMAQAWPEPVQLRRCCCQIASHDELTMAAVVGAAAWARRELAEEALSGLLRPERIESIWAAALELVAAEYA